MLFSRFFSALTRCAPHTVSASLSALALIFLLPQLPQGAQAQASTSTASAPSAPSAHSDLESTTPEATTSTTTSQLATSAAAAAPQSTEDSEEIATPANARALLVAISTAKRAERPAILQQLSELSDPVIAEMYQAWRAGKVVQDAQEEVFLERAGGYERLRDGARVQPEGKTRILRASRSLRKDFKRIVELLYLNAEDIDVRIAAVQKLGMSQNPDYLPEIKRRLAKQEKRKAKRAFEEAIAISELKNGSKEEQLAAIDTLTRLQSLASKNFLLDYNSRAQQDEQLPENERAQLEEKINFAIERIDLREKTSQWLNTIVRGISQGSVLLLVSYGLAITFGQMGVINMSHGEFIAIGGYCTYFMQNVFLRHFGQGSPESDWYFVCSLPVAFLSAALAGALLERGLIRFLYSRPLESLLATWGVSMVIQQLFRVFVGSANVSVSAPEFLSGSYELGMITISYARLLLIGFSLLVVALTWLLMSRTNWGLHVRATMQNRTMASNLGVPSARVNMLTFAFGSGLAGLAGAFISQIGNVGPAMGQAYIVDSFMVVVVGGVGNLLGTAISAFGIGTIDQALQPLLGPVMGKITVLFAIIAFLQLRPGGLFPARSRSLED